jgi:uncharacterized membrane protein
VKEAHVFDWVFDRFLGIPMHPLLVHFPVVLVPLLILSALAYAFVPRLRRYVGWLAVLLAVAAPVSALLAKKSGEAFRNIKVDQARSANIQLNLADINQHASFADAALWSSIALGALVLALVWLVRRSAGASPSMLITAVSAVLIVAASAVSMYYIFKAGDSGAHMVWRNQ